MPITAVTDLRGVKRLVSVAHNPILRGASSTAKNFFCSVMGKSPYPGLNRKVKYWPGKWFRMSSSVSSHTASMAAVAQQSMISPLAMSQACVQRIRRSAWADKVAANSTALLHPSKWEAMLCPGSSISHWGNPTLSGPCTMSNTAQRLAGRTAFSSSFRHCSTLSNVAASASF